MGVFLVFSTSRRCAEHKKHTHICVLGVQRDRDYCAPPVPIGTGRTGVGEGFMGWGRARKCQKHSHRGVFLVFKQRRASQHQNTSMGTHFWCWYGGKPAKTRNTPPWACFWFSRGVGLEGMQP